MLRVSTLAQPSTGRVVNELHAAMSDVAFEHLEAAIAYVTASGLRALRHGHEADLSRLDRRWLSSFDWCRAEPVALDALNQGGTSRVRIHQGAAVVNRPQCAPRLPFHPKGFLFTGPDARLLLSGSGNLSHNGIRQGVELDTLIDVRTPLAPGEQQAWDALGEVAVWFDGEWAKASAYQGALRAAYETAFASTPTTPAATEDDSVPDTAGHGYTAAQLTGAGRAAVFWTEAGNLTQNLGAGNPGSQLMMRAMTRVFFGFEARVVPHMTPLGTVDIKYGARIHPGLPLEFAHNGMDRLNLPHPGMNGPAKYDQETLVFRKVARRGGVIFALSLVQTAGEKNALRTKSAAAGLDLVMPGGRRFGFIPA